MNTRNWSFGFLLVAALAAWLGFAGKFEETVTELSRFLFFLFAALFIILGLMHLFIGDASGVDPKTS